MKRRQQQAVVLQLADALRERGSWCGETHLQKATYFLKKLAGVPLDFKFILYKHGPFSFDLRDELTAMRADKLMKLKVKQPPYGPSFLTTDPGKRLEARFPRTVSRYEEAIRFVADAFGQLGVRELESLATALYVTREMEGANRQQRADRIRELKSHISPQKAQEAVETVDEMKEQFKERQAA